MTATRDGTALPPGWRVELACCQSTLLREIADRRFKRNDVAITYSMALRSSERDTVDWKVVNDAIMERWSLSGLCYVKERAWKLSGRA